MLSMEQFEQREEVRRAEKESKKKYVNELKGLQKIGDQVQVQFVGIHGMSDVGGLDCHVMHLKSKKGNTYKLWVPCLRQNSTEGESDCPICNAKDLKGIGFNDVETNDSTTSFVIPLVMINHHIKFDPDKKAFVPEEYYSQGKIIQMSPEINKRMNSSKRFKDAFIKFLRQEGDLTNKVVSIEAVPAVDKNGKPSSVGFDFAFAVNTLVKPLNEAEFDIPNAEELFSNFNATDMDRYINTGSFFEKKSNDATASTEGVRQSNPTPSLDSYEGIPGTTLS